MSLPPIDDGGAGDDEPTLGLPPHPMDRIWRHPSELPSIAASAPRRPRLGAIRLRSFLTPIGAGAIGALLTVAVLAAAGAFDQHGTPAGDTHAPAARATDAIAGVAKRVSPAIVAVRVVLKTGTRTGSGVCIRRAGEVLTSARLVAGAQRVELVTSDGTVRSARITGLDPASDLALLSTTGDLEAADLAAPGSLQVGEPVYAVGADTSGRPWVSEGIVSSLDSRVASNGTTMTGLIESNALTGSAVAGGALLDRAGRVTGIVMMPATGHLTTAVPILLAGKVADALRANGHVSHGWLGLAGKVTSHGQVVITALATGGPAAIAGIRVGDIVVDADSQPIATMSDLMAEARGHWPGQQITLEVTRDRSNWTVSVRLAGMPTPGLPSPKPDPTPIAALRTVSLATAGPL